MANDTPRTDALIEKHTEDTVSLDPAFRTRGHAMRQAQELIDHARQLERELAVTNRSCDACLEEIDRLRSDLNKAIANHAADLSARPEELPSGWKLVPIVPTEAMVDAAMATPGINTVNNIVSMHMGRNGFAPIPELDCQGKSDSAIGKAYTAMVESAPQFMNVYHDCPDCGGTGSTPVAHCLRCGGTGQLPQEER